MVAGEVLLLLLRMMKPLLLLLLWWWVVVVMLHAVIGIRGRADGDVWLANCSCCWLVQSRSFSVGCTCIVGSLRGNGAVATAAGWLGRSLARRGGARRSARAQLRE